MKNDQSSPEMGDQPPPKEAVSLSLGEKLRAGIKQYNIDLVTLGLLIFYSISTISSSVEKVDAIEKDIDEIMQNVEIIKENVIALRLERSSGDSICLVRNSGLAERINYIEGSLRLPQKK